MAGNRILFGDFVLDPANFELRRGPDRIRLERIPMELLILLAQHQGRVVHRTEVVESIWGKGCFLESDSAINTAIRKLRRVLSDDPNRPTFIETVPGKGYRFVAATSGHQSRAEAVALYRRGLHFWNRKTPEWYLEAIRLFQQSIDKDPDYPLPHLGLAKAWIMQGIHGLQPSHDVYPRARAATARALELDENLAEAHAAMADIVKGYDWNWAEAERHYLRALELDPACTLAHHWYANLLSIVGRHDEAIVHAATARALEPLGVGPTGFVGFTYLRAQRYQDAIRESEGAHTLEPNSPIGNWFLGLALMALERFQEAEDALQVAVEHSHAAPMYLSALAYVQAARGEETRASEILSQLQRRARERYISPLDLAVVHAALKQWEAASDQLEAAETHRVMRLTELNMHWFDGMRRVERFAALCKRMGLASRETETPAA
jgi:serine/threonine-protein kinase